MVHFSRTLLGAAAASLIAAAAIASLVPVYSSLSQTYDEPFHIACGMEWLDRGRYTYEAQHPPLARVADAIGPYMKGLRSHIRETGWDEGNEILHSAGTYRRNLTLARLGALPFFLLACAAIFVWSRRWFSVGSAVWAVLLFSSVPPVLAAASQATTDMACAATVMLALYFFLRWLETPDLTRSIWLGISLALALLSKFSSIPFLGACAAAAFVYFALLKREWLHDLFPKNWHLIAVMVAVALFLLWAGYRFSFHSVSEERGFNRTLIDLSEQHSGPARLAGQLSTVPVPLPEFFHGLYMVVRHNGAGHDSFLLGEYRDHGWWSFFPILLLIKTPIGFLLLAGAGAVVIIAQLRRRIWHRRLTVIFPVALLAVCMASNLNLGIRHILPIYPLLAVLAGYAAAKAFRNSAKWVTAPAAVLLAGWSVADCWLTRPDYIAYFNQLAGSHPEHITVEADLGQDVGRLSQALREVGADHVALKLNTSARLAAEGLPPFEDVPPFERISGYVAISDWYLQIGYAENRSFAWLSNYTPLRRIGKTIWLYRIP
jgi:hypothetical protein